MGIDTSQKTESIEQLVDSIDKGEIVLPEFQRDFVWEEAKTYDLFDSLIRDIFIGSLIYGLPSFEMTVREIDMRPRKGVGSRKKLVHHSLTKSEIDARVKTGRLRLLLDGQQRITSVYRALKNIDEVWVIIRNEDELPEDTRQKELSERQLEEVLYQVAGRESPDHLSIRLADVYKMLKGQIVRERDKANLVSSTLYFRSQQVLDIQNSPMFELYLTHTGNILDLLKAEKLLSYYLLDTDEEKFSLFFERSNSRAIQLSFIDILAAKLYSGFNLRNKVEEFRDANPDHQLGQNEIVRAIAFLASKGKDIGRKFILSTLTHAHFTDNWDDLCLIYKKCFDYLYSNNMLISQQWLPYESIVLPLMIFLREIPNSDFSQADQVQSLFLKYWYWSVIFSERYSVAALDLIIQDMNILSHVAQKRYDFPSTYLDFSYQIQDYSDILSYSKKYGGIYRGILNFINYQSGGVHDWKNNSKISFKNSNLDDHHIFPRNYLLKKWLQPDVDEDRVDCVANRALVPKITNIRIGAKSPSQYLKELLADNPNLKSSLESHLIPTEIIDGDYDELYEIFLEDRAKKIINSINADLLPLKSKLKKDIFNV